MAIPRFGEKPEIIYANQGCSVRYIVQPGDSLRKIAKANHTSIQRLAEENNLTPNERGQYALGKLRSLCIPQDRVVYLQKQTALFAKKVPDLPRIGFQAPERVGYYKFGQAWSEMVGTTIDVRVLRGGNEVIVPAKVLRAWTNNESGIAAAYGPSNEYVQLQIADNAPGIIDSMNPLKDGETRYIPGGIHTVKLSRGFDPYLKPELIRLDD